MKKRFLYMVTACLMVFTLAAVPGLDWNRALTPWPARHAFRGGEDFAGEAAVHLRKLTGETVPAVERHLGFTPRQRGIAGYSLGGLFALYALWQSDAFALAASASGSLWYDGWLDYMREHKPQSTLRRAYISVGDREKKSRDSRLQTVEECSRAAVELLEGLGAETRFELNGGNHFKDAPLRMARALNFIGGEL